MIPLIKIKHPVGWGRPRWRGWRVTMDAFLIREGEMLPRGYGVAWREFDRDCIVVMPIPLNLIAGLLRRVWHWVRYATLTTSAMDGLVKRAFDRGYKAGRTETHSREEWIRNQAYDAGRRDELAELEKFARGD